MTLPQTFLLNPKLHAYLYVSSDFNDRQNVAKDMAKAMLCDTLPPCESCNVCKKIEAKAHPDVIYVSGAEKTGVDDIRKIEDEAYLAPNEADSRVFVLENADEYNVQSQNALLKILEEPPKSVRFILTAASPGALLSTVRSRVCTINGEKTDVLKISKDIAGLKTYLSEKQVSSLAHFVNHFDKTDIKALDEKAVFEYTDLAVSYLSGKDNLAIMSLPKKREDLMCAMQVLMLVTYEVSNAKCTGVLCNGFVEKNVLSQLSSKLSAKRAVMLYDVFEEAYLQINAYANVNAVLSFIWQNAK